MKKMILLSALMISVVANILSSDVKEGPRPAILKATWTLKNNTDIGSIKYSDKELIDARMTYSEDGYINNLRIERYSLRSTDSPDSFADMTFFAEDKISIINFVGFSRDTVVVWMFVDSQDGDIKIVSYKTDWKKKKLVKMNEISVPTFIAASSSLNGDVYISYLSLDLIENTIDVYDISLKKCKIRFQNSDFPFQLGNGIKDNIWATETSNDETNETVIKIFKLN